MGKFTLIVIIIGAVLALGGIYWGSRAKIGGVATGGSYELDKTSVDLGQMKVSEEKSGLFTLKNTGTSELELEDFNTSCNCTDAIVTVGDKISPRFNMMMHMSAEEAAWRAKVKPGETAAIELIYSPAKMPVYGAVSRYLDFKVGGKKEKLTVSATVE